MPRDFSHINSYLDLLLEDIYEQKPDAGHTQKLQEAVQNWSIYLSRVRNVLDIGCGMVAIAESSFKDLNIEYTGITLGNEVQSARRLGKNVLKMDMNFLEFGDDSFDAIFARHVLEHSPMALLTLMEWHRVSRHYLFLVSPTPEGYGYIGRNHYSVMHRQQLRWLLRRAGWKVINSQHTMDEFRFVCEKMPIIGYEGWAEAPLPPKIYEADRDE